MSWPQSIIDQFNAINPNTTIELEWYGPYNTLLVYTFKYEDGFGFRSTLNILFLRARSRLTSPWFTLSKGSITRYSYMRSNHIQILLTSPDTMVWIGRSSNILTSSQMVWSSLDFTLSLSWGRHLPPTPWRMLQVWWCPSKTSAPIKTSSEISHPGPGALWDSGSHQKGEVPQDHQGCQSNVSWNLSIITKYVFHIFLS